MSGRGCRRKKTRCSTSPTRCTCRPSWPRSGAAGSITPRPTGAPASSRPDLEWIAALSDDEFRELRGAGRQRLLADLRQRLIAQHKRNGLLPADLMAQSIRLLEPRLDRTLIIGFARRFATYKRATILLSDPGRLARLLGGDPQRPVLLVFAGKAHPHDGGGQALIRTLHEHSLTPEFIGRLVVVEGYDIGFARLRVQGCDIWLNTPEYPLEASGTSGMKAAINGGVNLSILDGWWAEGFDGTNGFGIAPRTDLADGGKRYDAEASALFETLEREVLPRWFDDPPRWLALARASMRTLLPQFGTARMMGDYVRRLYGPAARQGERMQGRHSRATIEFVRWKKLVHAQAPGLRPRVARSAGRLRPAQRSAPQGLHHRVSRQRGDPDLGPAQQRP
jgi:glycogen phosphorylase